MIFLSHLAPSYCLEAALPREQCYTPRPASIISRACHHTHFAVRKLVPGWVCVSKVSSQQHPEVGERDTRLPYSAPGCGPDSLWSVWGQVQQ